MLMLRYVARRVYAARYVCVYALRVYAASFSRLAAYHAMPLILAAMLAAAMLIYV